MEQFSTVHTPKQTSRPLNEITIMTIGIQRNLLCGFSGVYIRMKGGGMARSQIMYQLL